MAWKRAAWAGLALLLAGCLNQADNKAADDATTQFYQRVSAKQYAAIWDDAAPELNTTPKDQFVAMMQHIDDVMGACQPPTKNGAWATNINNGVAMRTQGYQRVCANGALTEKVTVVIRNHVAKIGGFSYNAPGAAPASNSATPPPAANTAPSNTAEQPMDNTLQALTSGQNGNPPASGGDQSGSQNNGGGGDQSGDESGGKDSGANGRNPGGGDDNEKHF
jgi:hypothetical protein